MSSCCSECEKFFFRGGLFFIFFRMPDKNNTNLAEMPQFPFLFLSDIALGGLLNRTRKLVVFLAFVWFCYKLAVITEILQKQTFGAFFGRKTSKNAVLPL